MSQSGQEDGEESAPAGEARHCSKQPNLPGMLGEGFFQAVEVSGNASI